MHQIRFRLGLGPTPLGWDCTYTAPSDPLVAFKGPTSKGRKGGKGSEVKGRRRETRGEEGMVG